jgi:hypothetical protein
MAKPGTRVSIKVVDHGMDAIQTWLDGFDPLEVKVGVVGSHAAARNDASGITNVELATIHEYGAPNANIPQRSFLRSTADRNRKKYKTLMTKVLGKAFDAKSSPKKALELLGGIVKGDMQATIFENKTLPAANRQLKTATIAARGDAGGTGTPTPLIDTGQLVNAIDFEVVKRR